MKALDGIKKKKWNCSSQRIVYWCREIIPFNFVEEFRRKLSIDIDPDTGSFQSQSQRCHSCDLEAECLQWPLPHEDRSQHLDLHMEEESFCITKIFPTTILAGTIIKRVFEHLITLLIYSHQEVKLINSSLMHTLVIFLHFPGHITSHKKKKMSPSNSHSLAGTGGHS